MSGAWLGLGFGVVDWLDLRFSVKPVLATYIRDSFTHEVMVLTFYIFDRIATRTLLMSMPILGPIGLGVLQICLHALSLYDT